MFWTPLEVHAFQILEFGVAYRKGLSINFQFTFLKSFMNFLKCLGISIQWIHILVGVPVLKSAPKVRIMFSKAQDPTNLPMEWNMGFLSGTPGLTGSTLISPFF